VFFWRSDLVDVIYCGFAPAHIHKVIRAVRDAISPYILVGGEDNAKQAAQRQSQTADPTT
jgi:hypothetical protein